MQPSNLFGRAVSLYGMKTLFQQLRDAGAKQRKAAIKVEYNETVQMNNVCSFND